MFIDCSIVVLVEFASARYVRWISFVIIIIEGSHGFLLGRFGIRYILIVTLLLFVFLLIFGLFVIRTLRFERSRLNLLVQLTLIINENLGKLNLVQRRGNMSGIDMGSSMTLVVNVFVFGVVVIGNLRILTKASGSFRVDFIL